MYVWELEDQAHIVCVCRKPWQGELKVEWSGCNVYFHPNCLYIPPECLNSSKLFVCTMCMWNGCEMWYIVSICIHETTSCMLILDACHIIRMLQTQWFLVAILFFFIVGVLGCDLMWFYSLCFEMWNASWWSLNDGWNFGAPRHRRPQLFLTTIFKTPSEGVCHLGRLSFK